MYTPNAGLSLFPRQSPISFPSQQLLVTISYAGLSVDYYLICKPSPRLHVDLVVLLHVHSAPHTPPSPSSHTAHSTAAATHTFDPRQHSPITNLHHFELSQHKHKQPTYTQTQVLPDVFSNMLHTLKRDTTSGTYKWVFINVFSHMILDHENLRTHIAQCEYIVSTCRHIIL